MNSEIPIAAPIPGLEWIAADWGTSNLRIWAIGADGEIADCRSSTSGMAKLQSHEFEGALLELVHSWLPAKGIVPVIACGMVGANQGWVDAGYRKIPCEPIGRSSLICAPTKNRRIKVSIIPGLCQDNPADVIRGEETQIAGYLETTPAKSSAVCMPGTHSKWIKLRHESVESFRTFITGELYSLIANYSVVRNAVDSYGWREDVFLEAVEDCLKGRAALTADIFGLRARSLISGDDAASLRSRLSGLLIGHELAEMRNSIGDGDIAIVGSQELTAPYGSALGFMECKTTVLNSERITIAGLKRARELSG